MKRRLTKDGTVRTPLPAGASRRDFLKHSALVAGMGVWVATGSRTYALSEQSTNERLNVASIGVGGKGDSDSEQAGKHANMIAICDVDEKRLNKKGEHFPKAKKYTDFRKLLDEKGKEIDACTISTPDHTHAMATMMAIKMGKAVYTQKPLTHDVWEARQLRMAAREHKVATQMGNQGTHNNRFRDGIEAIRAGAIGPVTEVYVWTNRPIWPQAPQITARPTEVDPVPPTLHWDNWIGSAPMRPYVGHRTYHDFNWRGWWDFGTGALGDMGCHTANLPFMALNLEYPTSIEGEAGDVNPETYPAWARVVFEFPARGDMPPVKFVWHEGRKNGKLVQPPKELVDKVLKESGARPNRAGKIELAGSGSIMVGSKGIFYSPDDYGGNWMLLPKDDFKDWKPPEKTLARNSDDGDEGQKIEWIAAAKGGPPALSNFNYAGLLAEFILLGNVAIKNHGQKLEWDGPNLKFTNNEAANKNLRREYRAPWSL
ncbi:MAG TPA: Gfo/Idh/MocA family oxidoreductase [Tepidisphaeraceae bacterium]|nr:Gfo/Idh/MocA family oxidoreductase [Tepidisphaeraceae bacterium]